MPSALNTKIRLLETEMQLFANDLHLAYQHAGALATYLNVEGNPNSATQCEAMSFDFYYMYNHWITGTTSIRYTLIWALDYINNYAFNGGVAEITMDAILEAIWNSDKLRWFHFINYIDSMRAGIWNTEIYDTHLADWYRHFST